MEKKTDYIVESHMDTPLLWSLEKLLEEMPKVQKHMMTLLEEAQDKMDTAWEDALQLGSIVTEIKKRLQ